MKKNNPHTPILIREAAGVEPKLWARYDFGKEKMEPLGGIVPYTACSFPQSNGPAGLDDKGIEGKVAELVKAA